MNAKQKAAELKRMLSAVDALAVEMKLKLRQKAREGYSGGLSSDPSIRYGIAKSLMEHAHELAGICPHCEAMDGEHDDEEYAKQAIDVCNLAMMIWVVNGKGV